MGGVLYIVFYIYMVFFRVLLVLDCCDSYSVQAYSISSWLFFFFFLNHYQVGPIVLYQRFRVIVVSEFYQLRLLGSEPCSSMLFRINRKVFCLLCRGANKTFQCNILSLLVKILEVQGPPAPPPSALVTRVFTLSVNPLII